MTTTIVPHPMLEDAALRRDASDPILTAPSMQEHPSKRPRVNEAKNGGKGMNVPFKMRIGCLSVLPNMPLDILYEIFGHLSPADLLSLARANKRFRRFLLTRTSSLSPWDTSLSSCGAPPRPEDMSPPAWSHLLFGTHCHSCGAPRVTKILFSLRRRACKSCLKIHLCCSRSSKVPTNYRDMIRFDSGYAECATHPSMFPCDKRWWDEDVEAFRSELNAFEPVACDPDGVLYGTRVAVSEFLAAKRNMVAGIQEHARICLEWEAARKMAKLADIRNKRFAYIREKFPSPSYQEEDVRGRGGVGISKPITERARERLEPRLRPKVNKSRHQRLIREGGKDYLQRWKVVVSQYSNFVKTLPPLPLTGRHLVVRAPPTPTEFLCENQALADAVVNGGPEFRTRVSEAIKGLAKDMLMEVVESHDCEALTVSLPSTPGA